MVLTMCVFHSHPTKKSTKFCFAALLNNKDGSWRRSDQPTPKRAFGTPANPRYHPHARVASGACPGCAGLGCFVRLGLRDRARQQPRKPFFLRRLSHHMPSLRRPPIEFLFVSLFILLLFLFGGFHRKVRFIGLVTQGHRSIGLEEGARRARRRRNRWLQAMAPLSCGAMLSTEGSAQLSTAFGGVVIPSPRLSFDHSRSRVSLASELLR